VQHPKNYVWIAATLLLAPSQKVYNKKVKLKSPEYEGSFCLSYARNNIGNEPRLCLNLLLD